MLLGKKDGEVYVHWSAVICLLMVVFCWPMLREFAAHMWFELHAPSAVDSHLYGAVGRGILNGLTPYSDLWESKPPGMFLVAALSLWLSGDLAYAHALQVLILLTIPLLFTVFAVQVVAKRPRSSTPILLTGSLLIGIAVSLYVGKRSGGFQTESFGAFFALLYLLKIARRERHMRMRDTFEASLWLLLASGFKEPYFVVCAVSAAAMLRTKRSFVEAFVIPAAIALAVGTIFMAVMGWLGAYVTLYLPEMFGGNLQGVGETREFTPFWKRGLFLRHLYDNLNLFCALMADVVACALLLTLHERRHDHRLLRRWLPIMLLFALLTYLTTLTVGLTDKFWTHHYVFAVPVYAAVVLSAIRHAHLRWDRHLVKLVFSAMLLLFCVSSSMFVPYDYEASLLAYHRADSRMREAAKEIDAVMDACDEERYLFFGSNGVQPYGYTEHSPLGPLFQQVEYWMSEEHPEFRESLLQNLRSTNLIVGSRLRLLDLTDEVERHRRQYFTETPWPCAREHDKGAFRIWYRKHAH